jgi:hypothetical protein
VSTTGFGLYGKAIISRQHTAVGSTHNWRHWVYTTLSCKFSHIRSRHLAAHKVLFLEEKVQTTANNASFNKRRSLPSINREPDAVTRTRRGYNYDTRPHVVYLRPPRREWPKPVRATTEDTLYSASSRKVRNSHRYIFNHTESYRHVFFSNIYTPPQVNLHSKMSTTFLTFLTLYSKPKKSVNLPPNTSLPFNKSLLINLRKQSIWHVLRYVVTMKILP